MPREPEAVADDPESDAEETRVSVVRGGLRRRVVLSVLTASGDCLEFALWPQQAHALSNDLLKAVAIVAKPLGSHGKGAA
jgi:hypothetical protein